MKLIWKLVPIVCLIAIAIMLMISLNIGQRVKEQQVLNYLPPIPVEDAAPNEAYSRYYPRQYSSWDKTRESDAIVDSSSPNRNSLSCGLAAASPRTTTHHAVTATPCRTTLTPCAPVRQPTKKAGRCHQPAGLAKVQT